MTFSDRLKKKINRVLLATLAVVLVLTSPRAQQPSATQPTSEDRIALYQALLDLTNPWTVMCVAAHPDDEDGTSLIVMRRKYGVHTVSLFSTFGEGGQNAIGPELYEELGAIRARETMAASEIQGSEPYFLGLKDFGFSKSRDETFQKWGHEEALRRMVLQIRKLRPDVIITNHSTTSNDHGHHQATALLVVEAFDAAADPNKFPEQLKDGVTTWQVQRLFVRQRGNQAPATDVRLVTIDPNERDPVRGTVFAEQALAALQKHATQGPWPKTFAEFTARFRAFSGQGGTTGQMPLIRYRIEREAKSAAALPKDSHDFLEGLRLPASLASEFQSPNINGQPLAVSIDNRASVLKSLIESAKSMRVVENAAPSDYQRLTRRSDSLHEAIRLASGFDLSLSVDQKTAIPGSSVKVTTIDSNGSDQKVTLDATRVVNPHSSVKETQVETIPVDWQFSSDPLFRDRWRTMEIKVTHRFQIGDLVVPVTAATHITVVPPVEITATGSSPIVVTPVDGSRSVSNGDCHYRSPEITVQITNNEEKAISGELSLYPATGRPLTGRGIATRPLTIAAHQKRTETFMVSGCQLPATNGSLTRGVSFLFNGAKGRTFPTLDVSVVMAEARIVPGIKVGYIRGFDFSLPNALTALGVVSKELTPDEVKTADLSKFTSIIVDNRVYESKPELIAANQKLLDYANAGGNLIVFYHKNDEWNPDERRNRPQLAPYKLILGGERITDENAPISFLEPDHPLLNTPNKLSQDDFKDWIQERGLYYPREWDPQFHALLQANDPGEAPLKGGLLVADYGRGHYIYTSMVWYRQLRAGVPGAYRMLANMISYGR